MMGIEVEATGLSKAVRGIQELESIGYTVEARVRDLDDLRKIGMRCTRSGRDVIVSFAKGTEVMLDGEIADLKANKLSFQPEKGSILLETIPGGCTLTVTQADGTIQCLHAVRPEPEERENPLASALLAVSGLLRRDGRREEKRHAYPKGTRYAVVCRDDLV